MALTAAERVALYRQRHPERIAAYKTANSKRQGAEQRSKYPERIRASWAKYREGDKYKAAYLRNHIKRKYGITLEHYNAMLEAQGGVCKICRCKEFRQWKDGRRQLTPLCVDHDHATGKVRGLLCNKCNAGIALFGEKEENLMSAVRYLKGA